MKYILIILAMLLSSLPITGSLRTINLDSVQKRLGHIFTPVAIKQKFVKLFWGKWNRDFFECDGKHEISLAVLILLPFNLFMYVFILIYLIMLVIACITKNETLLIFAYNKYVYDVVIYMVLLGVVTTVLKYWASTWKKPKVSAKEQKEAVRDLNKILKDIEKQKWYYQLSERLMNIACFSNDEKEEYWFKKSQVPIIKKLAKQSSKNAMVDLIYQNNELTGFTVIDITNDDIVFQGIIKEDVETQGDEKHKGTVLLSRPLSPMVGFLSQIGWIGHNNNVNNPEPKIQMERIFIDVDTNGGNGGGVFIWEVVNGLGSEFFHNKAPHRTPVCNKVIEYLED